MRVFNRAVLRPLAAVLVVLPMLPVAAQKGDEEEPSVLYVYTSPEGENVVGGGSDEGYADFSAKIDTKAGKICYVLEVGDVVPVAAHIHEGKAGANGGPVVTLEITGPGNEVCMALDAKLAKKVGSKPAGYYVNVHTAEFPGGALRGQLEN